MAIKLGSLENLLSDAFAFLKPMLPLAAAWFGFWLRGFESRADRLSGRVDDIIDEVSKLIEAASLYWKRDTVDKPKDADDIALEAEIQSRNHIINCLFENIALELKDGDNTIIRALISELRQVSTGRDFAAQKGHTSSGIAISSCYIVCAQIRTQLTASIQRRRRTPFPKR